MRSKGGAHGLFARGEDTAAERNAMHARSSKEASSIHDQREQDRRVREFVAGLTGADREFAESVGLAKPLADPEPHGTDRESDETEDGAEPVPHEKRRGTRNGKVLVAICEEVARAAAIEELEEVEVLEAHDAFGRAMAWVHVGHHMVKVGRRLAAFVGFVRPDLAVGEVELDASLRSDLVGMFDDVERRLLSLVFGRLLAWCRDSATLSAMGLRGAIIAYVVRPQLLDSATNQQLGNPTNSTRQAVNKLVQEFRDTFAGIRAPAMRGEGTRHACRAGQYVAA